MLKTIAATVSFQYSGQPFCTIIYSNGEVQNFTWDAANNGWGLLSQQNLAG